jgi:hypothetical protein
MPSWRFYRHVVRIGIFLRERLGVGPGDRVVIGSSLRLERALAEWATVCVGAVIVPLDPQASEDSLNALLAGVTPKAAITTRSEDYRNGVGLQGRLAAESVIELDGGSAAARTWSEILDLGGTLDTAERAEAFRAQARALTADMPAIEGGLQAQGGASGVLTHGDVIRRMREFWARVPPRDGDVAFIAADDPIFATTLPWMAFIADGRTTLALGTPGFAVEEICDLRPSLVVASTGLSDRIRRDVEATEPVALTPPTSLLERVPIVGTWVQRRRLAEDRASPRASIREILTFDGKPTTAITGANHVPVPRIHHQGSRSARLAGVSGHQHTNSR